MSLFVGRRRLGDTRLWYSRKITGVFQVLENWGVGVGERLGQVLGHSGRDRSTSTRTHPRIPVLLPYLPLPPAVPGSLHISQHIGERVYLDINAGRLLGPLACRGSLQGRRRTEQNKTGRCIAGNRANASPSEKRLPASPSPGPRLAEIIQQEQVFQVKKSCTS